MDFGVAGTKTKGDLSCERLVVEGRAEEGGRLARGGGSPVGPALPAVPARQPSPWRLGVQPGPRIRLELSSGLQMLADSGEGLGALSPGLELLYGECMRVCGCLPQGLLPSGQAGLAGGLPRQRERSAQGGSRAGDSPQSGVCTANMLFYFHDCVFTSSGFGWGTGCGGAKASRPPKATLGILTLSEL